MICLDASVLIAHVNPDDAHHRRARALLLRHAAQAFCASALTLAEFYAQPAKAGEEALRKAMRGVDILEIASVPVDAPERLAGLRASSGLKMPDCCVLDAAAATGAQVASFDTALRTAAEALGYPLAAED